MKLLFKVLTSLLLFYGCQKTQTSVIRFTNKSAIDTIAFQYGPTGMMMVDVTIDSIPYALIIDTGSTTTIFHNELKIPGEHIELDPQNPIIFTNINGDSTEFSHGTTIKKLSLSNINVLNFNYPRVKFNRLNNHGVLGNNILDHFVFKIDFYRSEILFAKHIAKFDTDGYESFPLSFHDGNPYIDVNIANKPFSLLIDTGNPANFISLNNKERPHFNSEDQVIHNWKTLRQPSPIDTIWTFEQQIIDQEGFTNTTINLGKYQLKDQYIKFSEHPISQVGQDFLSRFGSVIFDYQNSLIYLKKPNDKISLNQLLDIAKYVNSNGIVFSQDSIHKTVISISSLVENEGVKLHDTLLSLNGDDMKKKVHGFPDTDVTMTSDVLIDNFHFTMGNQNSTVDLKSTDGINTHILKRQYPVTTLPDTVYSFGLIQQFIYVSPTPIQKGYYTEYKVRQLPADIGKTKDALISNSAN